MFPALHCFHRLPCPAQIKANNVQAVVPHITWTPPPAAAAPMQQPLHQMWELLTAALGYNTAIDPHVAVAMLLSAAAVGSGSSATAAAPRQSEQVRKTWYASSIPG